MYRKARLQATLIAGAAAVTLGITALVFLAYAGYLGLLNTMAPALAALSTGAALLVLALLAVFVPRWHFRRQDRRRKQQQPQSDLDLVEHTLREHVDTLVSEGVRRHPSRSAIGTLLLGIAAGYGSSGLDGRRPPPKRRTAP